LRDSAGLQPDFAGSTPAGEYVPGSERIRPTADARETLERGATTAKVMTSTTTAIRSPGPPGSSITKTRCNRSSLSMRLGTSLPIAFGATAIG
jgi:hypothetical protein